MNEQSETVTNLIEIKKAQSGKGYILVGNDFDAWIWNSDVLLKQLLVAMSAWADTGEGKNLLIKQAKNEKRGFVVEPELIKNKPVIIAWKRSDYGFTTLAGEAIDSPNPFL